MPLGARSANYEPLENDLDGNTSSNAIRAKTFGWKTYAAAAIALIGLVYLFGSRSTDVPTDDQVIPSKPNDDSTLSNATITEGRAQFIVPAVGKPCSTWYQIHGNLNSSSTPLVLLHGGPGASSDYLESIADLSRLYARPVVFYDQLGNGQSTHLEEKKGDTTVWTEQLFLDELDNLLIHLGIRERYDVLGQSWGGMLAARHASLQPKGLRRLVLSSAPASMALWVEAQDRLLQSLPDEVRETLLEHEAAGTTDSKEYGDAMSVYSEQHMCRIKPMSAGRQRTMDWMSKDQTVYLTMNGPSDLHVTGTLKNWSMVEESRNITVPTLLLNGRFDAAQDSCVYPFFENIPHVKWVTLSNSSHCSHDEERERFMELVETFLLEDS